MSFIDGAIKPKLVEQKIVDRVMKVHEENKPFKIDFQLLRTNLLKFFLKNLVPIIIILIIIILLIYRYYDVKKKKAKKYKNYNDEEEENYYTDYNNDSDLDMEGDIDLD